MEPVVSIIIPIYNAEKTLKRCVDSVLTQEYTDFELFLIDDGSTDSSGQICDSYGEEDGRVRVVHKENTGVSASRNLAMDMARGKYLQFVDSDDWITPKATGLLVSAAENNCCDMVISDFYRVSGERLSRKSDIAEEGIMTRAEFAEHMMEKPADFYYGVLWNKLFRRDIVEKHSLRMNPKINWCEDFMFNLEYILHASTFYSLSIPVYYYFKRKGSLASQGISLRRSIQMKLTVFGYYNNFYKNVWDEADYEKHQFQIYRFLIDAAADGTVPPTLISGSKKLGEERSIIFYEAMEGDGEVIDAYRERKILDYYLETAAEKNSLSLAEVRLLMDIELVEGFITRREMADFAGITTRRLSELSGQLSRKGYIRVIKPEKAEKPDKPKKDESKTSEDKPEKKKEPKTISFELLEPAKGVMEDIARAKANCEGAKFADFTEEEMASYEQLQKKIKQNIQKIL